MQQRAARTVVSVLLAVLVGTPSVAAADAGVPFPAAAARAGAPSRWAEGRVLVGYARGATTADRERAHQAAKASRARPLKGVPGVELVETPLAVGDAIGRLKGAHGVRYAQPDYVVRASFTPDDPDYGVQWGLHQPGGIDIGAQAAWDVTTGSASTVVAVIDTGIQLDHPDLAANIWTNPGEIAGNGIDDDDDGYVDDVHGWDFVDDDDDPSDENGHGTHVSGTIAAVGDNGMGVAGVAFGSRVLPLRMLDADGDGYLSDGMRALAYAKAHGARVANLSWTYEGPISQPLWDAIQAAGDAGMLVTAAAGNQAFDADQRPVYPAAFDLPNVVSVAALAQNGTLAAFSNRGLASVDLAAPGEHILSTWLGGGYKYLQGTSMASPHVAGVAALLVSQHPGWTVAQVRDRLLGTTHPLAALTGLVGTGGLVDAAAALGPGLDRAPVVTITAPSSGATVQPGTAVHLTATAVDPEDGNVAASITWRSNLMGNLGTGPAITRADLSMGTHLIVASARDSAGHRRSATLVVRVAPPISFLDDHSEPYASTIAIAPDGSPIVSWTELGKGTVVSRRGAGGWSREVVSMAYFDGWPDLAVDPGGTVHVAVDREWKSIGSSSDGGILVASDDGTGAGTGWTEARVSEGCGDDADGCALDTYPSIAREPSGRLHVTWARVPFQGVDSNHPGLWHAVSHAGGTWTAEQVLDAENVVLPDVAIGADGSTHIAFWREPSGPDPGLYHATNASGDWVIEQVAEFPADGGFGLPRVQVGADGRVDVAWGTSAGVFVRSQIAGLWQAPVTVTPHAAGHVDLVRDGTTLHLVYEGNDEHRVATGIGYAVDHGAGWTVEDVDVGQDVLPHLAVDAAGHPHVSYQRDFPEHELRYATNDGTGWTTEVVDRGWTWTEPAIGVDAAGHHHVAVGRYGTEPGIWYATDASGSWSMERLTQVQPDGPVTLVVAPDGTVSISYAEYYDETNVPLPDRAIWLKTGKAGSWTTRRIATNTGGAGPSIARGSTGRLSIAFSTNITGHVRIAVASNASGSWQTSYATTGSTTTVDTEPSIAIDAKGRIHIAYQEGTPETGAVAVRYVTNASGAWVKRLIAAGVDAFDWQLQPRLALTAAGAPRIAFWRYNHGIRLATRSGTTWSTRTVTSSEFDVSPSLAVDAHGSSHLLWTRSVGYGICAIPFCPEAPGLRWWSNEPGFGGPRRVADYADDGDPVIAIGADGSIAGAFVAPSWHLGVVDLRTAPPKVSALAIHLAASGTVAADRSHLTITFTGRHAAKYRLAQQVNGGPWHTVGSLTGATSRTLTVPQAWSTARRFRVTAYDGLGRTGNTATGRTVRTWGHSEAPGTGVAYGGSWATAHKGAFRGGAARVATSASASITWTVAAREVAWVALRAPNQGDARVYVDGTLVTTIHLWSGTAAYRQIVFRRVFGSVGRHRITIKPVGNGRVTVDGFLALR